MLRITVYNLNKRLAVEKMWPMYCYDQTKLNYEMYALEFKCKRILPLYYKF